MFSHLLVRLAVKLIILIVLVEIAVQTSFVSIAVKNVELPPHHDARRLQLRGLMTEFA